MSIVRWYPTREQTAFPSDVHNMQREINRMFDSFFHDGLADDGTVFTSSWTPAVDVAEKENGYLVKVELPGVDKEDVKITLQNNVLTIKGEKKQEKETKGTSYYRVERSYGTFQRSFTLPTGVRADGIEASYENGVLQIELPKPEEAKPKQIDVKVK